VLLIAHVEFDMCDVKRQMDLGKSHPEKNKYPLNKLQKSPYYKKIFNILQMYGKLPPEKLPWGSFPVTYIVYTVNN